MELTFAQDYWPWTSLYFCFVVRYARTTTLFVA